MDGFFIRWNSNIQKLTYLVFFVAGWRRSWAPPEIPEVVQKPERREEWEIYSNIFWPFCSFGQKSCLLAVCFPLVLFWIIITDIYAIIYSDSKNPNICLVKINWNTACFSLIRYLKGSCVCFNIPMNAVRSLFAKHNIECVNAWMCFMTKNKTIIA